MSEQLLPENTCEPSKEDLEKQKLQLEIKHLNKIWVRKPEWWPPIATIVVIVGGLLAGFFSKENLIQKISNLNKSEDSLIIKNDSLIKTKDSLTRQNLSLIRGNKIISHQNDSISGINHSLKRNLDNLKIESKNKGEKFNNLSLENAGLFSKNRIQRDSLNYMYRFSSAMERGQEVTFNNQERRVTNAQNEINRLAGKVSELRGRAHGFTSILDDLGNNAKMDSCRALGLIPWVRQEYKFTLAAMDSNDPH
jgi:hypothetical protein